MIRLALRARPLMRLSLRGFIPERLAGLTASAIARQPLRQGNRPGVLGDLFAVDVSASAEDRLVIDGSDERLDDVGAGMSNGELVVEGNVGARVGLEMTGGRILVRGSASAGRSEGFWCLATVSRKCLERRGDLPRTRVGSSPPGPVVLRGLHPYKQPRGNS